MPVNVKYCGELGSAMPFLPTNDTHPFHQSDAIKLWSLQIVKLTGMIMVINCEINRYDYGDTKIFRTFFSVISRIYVYT